VTGGTHHHIVVAYVTCMRHVSNYERCVEPSLSCDTVSTVNLMCRHSPFGECDAVGISSAEVVVGHRYH